MGIWIFMLIANLLIPFSMIGFGCYFMKTGGPKKINMVFGYRTAMSVKNGDTWRFAHIHCGKSWWIAGWILLPISIVAMLFLFGKDIDTVEIFGSIVTGVQLILFIGSIMPTEIALRKHFNENGIRKTER